MYLVIHVAIKCLAANIFFSLDHESSNGNGALIKFSKASFSKLSVQMFAEMEIPMDSASWNQYGGMYKISPSCRVICTGPFSSVWNCGNSFLSTEVGSTCDVRWHACKRGYRYKYLHHEGGYNVNFFCPLI